MIFVERKGEEPVSLGSLATLAQAQAAEQYYATWSIGDPGFDNFTRYREYDIQQALRKLFHGKCAYCEKLIEKGIAEVEHYRPKAGVKGSTHSGYWWLAYKWTNLLPTCPGCNQGLKQHVITVEMTVAEVEAMQATPPQKLLGKATQFPVGATRLVAQDDNHDAEQPHLIDPTRTDPTCELLWRHEADYSVVEAALGATGPSVLGMATIHCVALNRSDLVQSRTAILNRLKAHRTRILGDLEKEAVEIDDPGLLSLHLRAALRRVDDMKLACAPEQPFSAMASAFVDDFRTELRQWASEKAAGG
ncbi:hypothetical protein ASG43_17420 [Aureimonas sp. Leaf454]|uniref:HNH endonuclease n=1 Tax=Aureimonas sp. Leaf454 TaxID=1736381 RepID=UPI0006FF351C|nr:HNH endonuclease [Aureimonas sp. Leaf454]KQT42055.1 hypothetical protein ASG43_17420 [Aureimonas sp. Leaf454]